MPPKNSIEITYIANTGFLIQSKDKRIVIDGFFKEGWRLFDSIPQKVQNRIEQGQSQFENIDLVLVTHWHEDHFDATLVAKHLLNNPNTCFLSTKQVIDRLNDSSIDLSTISSRIHASSEDWNEIEELTIADLPLQIIKARHSVYEVQDEETGEMYDRHKEVENLIFILNLEGKRILHIGDAGPDINYELFQSLRSIFEKGTYVAFLHGWFLINSTGQKIIKDFIKPKYIIPMHLPLKERDSFISELLQLYSNLITFRKPLTKEQFC